MIVSLADGSRRAGACRHAAARETPDADCWSRSRIALSLAERTMNILLAFGLIRILYFRFDEKEGFYVHIRFPRWPRRPPAAFSPASPAIPWAKRQARATAPRA